MVHDATPRHGVQRADSKQARCSGQRQICRNVKRRSNAWLAWMKTLAGFLLAAIYTNRLAKIATQSTAVSREAGNINTST